MYEARCFLRCAHACDALQSKRLGSSGASGAADVQQHEFFKPINWRKLELREVRVSSSRASAALLTRVSLLDHRAVQARRCQRAVRIATRHP